jgi:glycosyltransferase involved in cell wall biosynthesis
MFSVVIPTVGDRESLDEAVASAESQTVDAEVIIEHDTDRTGSGATLNRAIARATKPYIALLDDDDLFLPTRLERVAELVAPDRLVTTNSIVQREGRAEVHWYPDFESPDFPADNAGQRVEILRRNFLFTQGVFARSAWERVGGFSIETPTEDYDLWVRLIYGGCTAHLIEEPLSVYRIHGLNVSMNRRLMMVGEFSVVARAPVETSAEMDARDERVLSIITRLELLSASDAIRRGSKALARELCRSVAVNPRQVGRQRLRAAASAVAPGVARRYATKEQP